ncbi:C6 zinc finger domain-containing protein [Neofusicoccum parvum]|nr:C6 zinc finger domain-containing protein [Neofusicoccum parvum]
MALDLFASQLHNVTEENCHAFVLLSSLIFKINATSIAESHRRGQKVTADDVAQSFMLGQGVKSILSLPSAWKWAGSGPLSPILDDIDPVPHPTGEFITQIDNLLGLTRAISGSPDAIDVRSSCFLAIESLRHTYATMLAQNARPGRVWTWPITAPPRFLELISTGNPVALVILAHYCALVRCVEGGLWGLEGWSDGVMAAVDCALNESWKVWIEWPMKCLRERIDITSTDEQLI